MSTPASLSAGPALLRLGTRGSPLALAQAHETRRRLAAAWPDLAAEGAVEIVVIKTTGDMVQDRTLADIGGKGLFTKEIEEALFEGRIDLAVHSMKDLPTWLPDGLTLGAILPREDPRDALIGPAGCGWASLADIPPGALIGTASLRRKAQLLAARPDLIVEPLRGNVHTRIRRIEDGAFAATFLAVAGLNRLGESARITAALSPLDMLPAAAQGAVAIELRADDPETRRRLAPLNCAVTEIAVTAERALLAELDGSCRTPIAALARVAGDQVSLEALVASEDGRRVRRDRVEGDAGDAAALGKQLGLRLK